MQDWSDDAFAGYLAGMVDGEGHIELVREYAVRVRIANTIKPTLDAIQTRLGFGRVIEYARPKGRNYKRLFCYEVSNVQDVERLFAVCGAFIHMKLEARDKALAICARVRADVEKLDERNRAILAAIAEGRVQNQIAREFGVSPQLVSRIKKGHTWSSVITTHRSRALQRYNPRGADQSMRLHPES